MHKFGTFWIYLFFSDKCLLRGFSFTIVRYNFTEFCGYYARLGSEVLRSIIIFYEIIMAKFQTNKLMHEK